MTVQWRLARFADLTPVQLHDLYQLRAAVFVVEQKCAFQDIDGADPPSWHLMGYEGASLAAYCRLVPPGTKFAEASIGRVVTAGAARRSGLGRELMRQAVAHTQKLWPGKDLRIGAQQYLERFYGEFGFVTDSAPYDEDGIMHVEMQRKASSPADRDAQNVGQ